MIDEVNLYIVTNIRGPKARAGKGMYLLECRINGKPYTINEIIVSESITENELTLTLLTKALERMQKSSTIRINTQCEHVLITLNNMWNIQWEKNNWRNAKGNIVKNYELWQQVTELLRAHVYTISKDWHSYKQWMLTEMKKG